jgi:hypothetical protein
MNCVWIGYLLEHVAGGFGKVSKLSANEKAVGRHRAERRCFSRANVLEGAPLLAGCEVGLENFGEPPDNLAVSVGVLDLNSMARVTLLQCPYFQRCPISPASLFDQSVTQCALRKGLILQGRVVCLLSLKGASEVRGCCVRTCVAGLT